LLTGTSPEVDDRILAATEVVQTEAASSPVRVLRPSDQLFHVCVHAVHPAWSASPRWMLDVAAILDAEGSRIDWAGVVDRARRTSTTLRLRTAVAELQAVLGERIPSEVEEELRSAAPAVWERHELALIARMPPYSGPDLARWHWFQFRRLRAGDRSWAHRALPAGFADYLRLKLLVRWRDRAAGVSRWASV
jgi:hypothetical protein